MKLTMSGASDGNLYKFILHGLQRKWRSPGHWKLIDLPNNYFVVKFDLEEDMEEALCGGPWVLSGHTLMVRKWSSSFKAMTDKVRYMAVWARIEGLPLKYFTEYAMSKVGKLIGEVVKVDTVTLQEERGQYGRVCVEVDLDKPFKPVVEVDDVVYGVRYEGLHLLCFKCGMFGHSKENCLEGKETMQEVGQNAKGAVNPIDTADIPGVVEEVAMVDSNVEEPVDKFGPWMLIDYRNRRKGGKGAGAKPMSTNGSRFSVLVEEAEAMPHQTLNDTPIQEPSHITPKSFHDKSKVSKGQNVPEIVEMWNCLQTKLKENEDVKDLLGPGVSVMDEMIKEKTTVEAKKSRRFEIGKDSRIPLLDKSNASWVKGRNSFKLLKKPSVVRNVSISEAPPLQPFQDNPDFSMVDFSGVFGRGPPEDPGSRRDLGSRDFGVKGIVAQFEVSTDGTNGDVSLGGSSYIGDANADI